MNKRRAGLRSVRGWLALVTLFAWVSAFGVCTTHCAFGMPAPESGNHSRCHSEQSSDHSKSDCSGAFCTTFKSLDAAVADIVLHPPQTLALFQPVLAAASAVEVDLIYLPQVLRQSRPSDFLFTPEVYSGPAYLPHGPPIFVEPSA